MGYPKQYVGHYPILAKWLRSQGHIVYPMEMVCEAVRIPDKEHQYNSHYLYGAVDVVSMFHDKLWAWEYKSRNDSVLRGMLQVENYRRSFDYVSLVAEDLAKVDSVVRKKGLRVSTILKHLGVGIFWNDEGKIGVVIEPIEQAPQKKLRDKLLIRFRRNVLRKPTPSIAETSLLKFCNSGE